jgi:hypothetical protein
MLITFLLLHINISEKKTFPFALDIGGSEIVIIFFMFDEWMWPHGNWPSNTGAKAVV